MLAGHSYGGFISRLFAAMYRSETSGLVLIDSSHEREIEPYRRHYGDSPEGDWVDGGDRIDMDATARTLRRKARDLGDLPLAVVKAGTYEDVLTTQLWDRTQADLATLSSNSVFVQATGGHFGDERRPAGAPDRDRCCRRECPIEYATSVCEQVLEGTDGTCPPTRP